MAAKVGRNDPCPCGSGKKYKKCCLGWGLRVEPGLASGVLDEFREAAGNREFQSLEELQAFADDYMGGRNRAPIEDFHGLSAEQMQQLLYERFDSPSLVTFPETLATEPRAPAASLFEWLARAIADGELKPTAKGNLPRQICRDIAERYRKGWPYPGRRLEPSVNSELDFEELHAVRLLAEQAGLVRKYKGKFILSRECRGLLEADGLNTIYPRLFMTYARTFNWGYRDGYPALGFLQQSSLFTLYLLQLHGEAPKSRRFYEDAFLSPSPPSSTRWRMATVPPRIRCGPAMPCAPSVGSPGSLAW
jgi:hypothetical protein